MTRRKQPDFIKGTAAHRRTEGDYLSVLLDTVTLDDWREVVGNTLQAAKDGDAQARSWLAQYLVGKPEIKAQTSRIPCWLQRSRNARMNSGGAT